MSENRSVNENDSGVWINLASGPSLAQSLRFDPAEAESVQRIAEMRPDVDPGEALARAWNPALNNSQTRGVLSLHLNERLLGCVFAEQENAFVVTMKPLLDGSAPRESLAAALRLAVKTLFQVDGIVKVQTFAKPDSPVVGLSQSLGATVEGFFKHGAVYQGRVCDVMGLAFFKEDLDERDHRRAN